MIDHALWHVVLISFKAEASPAVQNDVYEKYQVLAEQCGGKKAGILFWKVGWNIDLRKGVQLVEIAVFESDAALQRFREHPRHKEMTNLLRQIADWKVGDIHHPFDTS